MLPLTRTSPTSVRQKLRRSLKSLSSRSETRPAYIPHTRCSLDGPCFRLSLALVRSAGCTCGYRQQHKCLPSPWLRGLRLEMTGAIAIEVSRPSRGAAQRASSRVRTFSSDASLSQPAKSLPLKVTKPANESSRAPRQGERVCLSQQHGASERRSSLHTLALGSPSGRRYLQWPCRTVIRHQRD